MTPVERAVDAISEYLPDQILAELVVVQVLKALREPSEAMLGAGMMGLSNSGVDDANSGDATSCWQAMIDAALGEG